MSSALAYGTQQISARYAIYHCVTRATLDPTYLPCGHAPVIVVDCGFPSSKCCGIAIAPPSRSAIRLCTSGAGIGMLLVSTGRE